ncbi:hypothetical protein [Streptomyces flavofungini]|uniref:Uncharacterized protein n=1 Tax=Streptomyces flavofungini TaxID=68200 RepID=A0ABS0X594_9ACTN|nr:hypothetical protein [Streptomyces flavofungini]MBJ3808367.1 hypothetical protein [Streptomyces flavofungini]GHC58192.1 hypothetical protein GCM10010349_26480 [Streptomyces flavofungini]
MSERDPAAGGPYPKTARARVALAYEAYELAELARASVPVSAHTPPGATLAEAAQLRRAAHRLLEAAAVYERAAGADWRVIGAALNVSARTARQRFDAAEARFHERLSCADEPNGWRSYLLRHPLEAAQDLDDWVLRHQDGDSDLGDAPVSGPLLRPTPRGHP